MSDAPEILKLKEELSGLPESLSWEQLWDLRTKVGELMIGATNPETRSILKAIYEKFTIQLKARAEELGKAEEFAEADRLTEEINESKDRDLRIARTQSVVAYGGWLSQAIIIYRHATAPLPELVAEANKVLDMAMVASNARINEAVEEKVRFETFNQRDPSKLLPPHYFDTLLKTYKHTYRVAANAESGARISLWTRIGAAIEMQRDLRRGSRWLGGWPGL